jgi:hypothetical protein
MANTRISASALVALKEALTVIYWYKADLRSFLARALNEPELLARYDWDASYKRAIVSELIDFMAARESTYQDELVHLIEEVCDIADFAHLRQLEDGAAKEAAAATAVRALRSHAQGHLQLAEEVRRGRERRVKVKADDADRQAFSGKLDTLRDEYLKMATTDDLTPQQRGYELEQFLQELFGLFDLDPKASFRIVGEQIDGAFTFESTDYLLSAKWQRLPVGLEDLDAFKGKVGRKLENTLGLFVSINGFSTTAIPVHQADGPVMLLMDGADLMAVLDARIDLPELLRRKRRHASQTGEPMLPVSEIL